MKRAKQILKILFFALTGVLALAGLTLAGFALIPPKPLKPSHPQIPDQSAFKLDEKVGWYQTDDDRRLMLTWGSTGGLTINEFAPIDGGDLVPVNADQYLWKPYYLKEEYRVTFQHDAGGKVTGMQWADAAGRQHDAARLEGHAYDQAEVRYRNGGVELVGLLMTPLAEGPHPAVVFVHGSGNSIRDYSYYLHMADHLARQGCIVLLPDKRGCGKSGGEWLTSSFEDYAGDALAAVDLLTGVEAVDGGRIGLVGISQGGWILPLAASKSERVRFIVSVSGSATILDETMRHEISADMRDKGVPGWAISIVEPVVSSRVRKSHGEFWRLNGYFDPLPYWKKLSIPALVLNGRLDKNVPVPASLARLEEVRRSNGKADIAFQTYDESGHCLVDPLTGRDPRLAGARQDALDLMTEWIQTATQ